MSPAVACFPTGGVCRRMSSLSSTSEVTALLQGEEDGRPGTVVLSNPADWQGYAVGPGRGEPGGVAPGGVLGWAMAVRPIAGEGPILPIPGH